MTRLTTSEFVAMAEELRDYAAAHPINILKRMQSGLGAPVEHRRDFQYRDHDVRVLLTEDVLDFPSRPMRGVHLSVVSLDGSALPEALTAEVLAAFFPAQAQDQPKIVMDVGLEPGLLLTMPSPFSGVTQYVVLTPVEKAEPLAGDLRPPASAGPGQGDGEWR